MAAQASLPLFEDSLPAVGPKRSASRSREFRPEREFLPGEFLPEKPAAPAVQRGQRTDPQINPHLLAARRLARRMRRLRAKPEEQTRTGQAICHHLKALLTETDG
jgi:hypothetical protein